LNPGCAGIFFIRGWRNEQHSFSYPKKIEDVIVLIRFVFGLVGSLSDFFCHLSVKMKSFVGKVFSELLICIFAYHKINVVS
jgi:hypothetical protein